jgi:hypothetical protein
LAFARRISAVVSCSVRSHSMTVGGYSTENAVLSPERTLLVPIRFVMASRREAVAEGEMVKER